MARSVRAHGGWFNYRRRIKPRAPRHPIARKPKATIITAIGLINGARSEHGRTLKQPGSAQSMRWFPSLSIPSVHVCATWPPAAGGSVGVRVGVCVAVDVGVRVGVWVGVAVGVLVAVRVGVAVGVWVGVRVGVCVGVAV